MAEIEGMLMTGVAGKKLQETAFIPKHTSGADVVNVDVATDWLQLQKVGRVE